MMEMEIALLFQFLYFVHLDSTAMEMETVFQAHHHFQQFVHLDSKAMEKETAYHFQSLRRFFAAADSQDVEIIRMRFQESQDGCRRTVRLQQLVVKMKLKDFMKQVQ